MSIRRNAETTRKQSARRTPRRATLVVAGTLIVVLAAPVVPAWATEISVEERQSWTLEEARQHAEDAGMKAPEVRQVPASEVDPDLETDTSAPEPMPEDKPEPVEYPEPGSVTLSLPAASEGALSSPQSRDSASDEASGKAGGFEVAVRAVASDADRTAEAGPRGDVRVTSLDSASAEAVGASRGVFTVESVTQTGLASTSATSSGEAAKVEVSVDVSHLAAAGGDLAHRLRLVELPECVIETPDRADCRIPSPVEGGRLVYGEDGVPQAVAGTVKLPESSQNRAEESPSTLENAGLLAVPQTAPVRADRDVTVLAVMASASGSTGDWAATSLSPSAKWDVAAQTGSFSWSYPFRTSPVPGGLAPDLSLSYSSGSLDGRVASTNNQSSQIGDGWEGNFSGYIERKYVPCSEDQASKNGQAANNANRDTGDLCWKSNNATLMFNGSATELVRDGNTNTWRPKNDDNSVVSHATGGWNTDNDKEYWKLTTADGTQYWFGRAKRSADDPASLSSGSVVPVYGNHPGEPCYAATFAASRCSQAWRWNLDYVVDTSGNSMTYTYERENNRYGYNLNEGTILYNRASRLLQIEYGTRTGSDTSGVAPARVAFEYAERCIPTSTFDCAEADLNDANSAHWPDVPQDQRCASTTTCPEVSSPVFFDRKRLVGVTTQVHQSGSYQDVDSWALAQRFPNPGDGTKATVWLESITHTGKGGAASDVALPAVTFSGVQKDNRVEAVEEIAPAMTRWRIDRITSESGGVTTVAYSGEECAPGNLPVNPQSNGMRCMPVYWTPQGFTEPQREYFHHYRVTNVVEDPKIAGNQPLVTSYSYSAGTAWHYDDNELVKPKHRTWGELRGYSTVSVYKGTADVEGAPRMRTQYRYFRGMHGDRDGSGGTKSVQVDGIDDLEQYSGMARQTTTYNGASVVSTTLSTPWRSVSSATDPESGTKAFHTEVGESETRVTLASGGIRTTRVATSFDSIGMPEVVNDHGDVNVAGDEQCTRTTYIRNADVRILETVQRIETVGVSCDSDVTRPRDVVSDERFAYDSLAVGSAPTRGRVTLRQEVGSYSGTSPVYVDVERSNHNTYGQLTEQTDAKGNTTTTAYDNASGLTTKTTVTSPDPDGSGALTRHVATTELNPIWGVPTKVTDANNKVTTGTYDGLGRLTQVWEPGRVQGTHTPNTKFSYFVRSTGMNAVKTETLNHDASAYVASSQIYDGLLRQRQTQSPSASSSTAGRVITDTLYDSRGLAHLTRDGWNTSGAAVSTLVVASAAVDSRVETEFDGAGRPVSETFQVGEGDKPDDDVSYLPKWTTTTSYEGDRVSVNPPDGGVPTTTVSDARGNTTELWQYTGPSPSGTHHVTSYRYDDADRLVEVNDPEGNRWSYTYDLRGRQTSASDPDKGDSSSTYDATGNIVTSTDARGEKLAYTYDALGRKTSMRDDTTTGNVRAQWTYDTVAKGQLTGNVRLDGTDRYTTTVTGYNDRYQPLGQTVSLPDSLGEELAGDYTTGFTYTSDGRVESQAMPAAGSLGAESVWTLYSDNNAADALAGPGAWGFYVLGADYLPTGELSYLQTGNTYAYEQESIYEVGTRRLDGVTLTQQTSDQLRELRHAAYEYDDAGNVLSVKDTPELGGQPKDQQCFDYDWARRLTDAWTPASGDCAVAPSVAGLGGADPYWKSYSHDVLGNRNSTVLHRSMAQGGDVTSAYVQSASGVNSVRPHATTRVTATGTSGALGNSTYAYDAAGNMTARTVAGEAGQTLSWDAEGELAGVESDANGDGSVAESESDEYVYSADGDRLVRKQDGATTIYLPGQEVTVSATGAVSAQRYYSFAGQTVAVRTGNLASAVTSVFADHHGTGTTQISNVSNTVTRRFLDPFGAERDSAAGLPSEDAPASGWVGDRGFLDKTTDTSGLTSVGARFYDPVLGSFISVDPVMDLSDPQQWNAYAYGYNNPITFSDPTGLKPIGAGHEGYDPRTQPDGGDPCAGATSCVKTKNGKNGPVKVRECYTAYACGYFSTHADGYTTSGGGSVDLVDGRGSLGNRTLYRTGAAAAAQAAARAREMAQIEAKNAERERLTKEADQKNTWIESAGTWITGATDATWNAMKSAGSWVAGHTNEILIGLSIVGFVACLVVTVGTCAAVGAVLAVAGGLNDRFINKKSWADTGKTFALNMVFVGAGAGLGAGLNGFLKGTAPLTRIENAGIGASTGAPGLSCTAIAIRGSSC